MPLERNQFSRVAVMTTSGGFAVLALGRGLLAPRRAAAGPSGTSGSTSARTGGSGVAVRGKNLVASKACSRSSTP